MSGKNLYNNYDKHPYAVINGFDGQAWSGYGAVIPELRRRIAEVSCNEDHAVICFDLYPGVNQGEILKMVGGLSPELVIDTEELAKSEEQLNAEFGDFLTDDRVFGVICHKKLEDFFDEKKVEKARERIAGQNKGLTAIVGVGAGLLVGEGEPAGAGTSARGGYPAEAGTSARGGYPAGAGTSARGGNPAEAGDPAGGITSVGCGSFDRCGSPADREFPAHADLTVYCPITRWEIQLRYRKGMPNWHCTNSQAPVLEKVKRGFFVEWRLADRYKKERYGSFDYVLETEMKDRPNMITGEAFQAGLEKLSRRPFRMEPYFDPGVWGGHWMQEHFGLNPDEENFAWSFDGVPEENAINLQFGEVTVKLPAIDLVFTHPRELLGDRVHGRFGVEFPIRFDLLDTMGGGNLSLQVHPLTEYIQDTFGMHYTQDESYYILDADETEETYVYLGVKNGVDRDAMARDLKMAESGQIQFPADTYVNRIPVKKHDHVLIPAGTVHCSGKNTMVLEISATPYIFTFKLWDWGRVGLDGVPRPIHVEHGLKNIQWDRDTDWVNDQIVHQETTLLDENGLKLERTGLHNREFIETLRYTLSEPVELQMDDSVHVMNLVDGKCAMLESLDGSFEPFRLHYAETAIVPAGVKQYRIVPEEGTCMVIVASVRR